jgi:carboxyvinyl-carboxyphosphonate phosphorylmutase
LEANAPRTRLRDILAGERSVLMASVHDPISARIAQELGCEAALMGGSLASMAVLGAPDLIVLTLTELAEQVHRCTRSSEVPLVVDGDHGYGNALNVMRTVQELEHAGAAAVSIEDTLLPRAFGTGPLAQLVSIDEGAGKMKAAIAARRDSRFVILGRTSATAVSGVDDAIARLRAYEAAGVDALMIPGLKSRDELDRIASATRLPLVIGGIPEAMCDPAYLASRRGRLWSGGHHTFNVAVKALYDAMKAVHGGVLAPKLSGSAGKELMDGVTNAASYADWIKRFLGSDAGRDA